MSPAVEPSSFLADRGAALTLRGLRKAFGAKTVLNGVDLHVPVGQSFVIIGRSGCGKSTLLRLIAGLDEPSAGTIEVAGVISRGTEPAVQNVILRLERGRLPFGLLRRSSRLKERAARVR
jgi:ABC-type multidrug transport system ATPase subunit